MAKGGTGRAQHSEFRRPKKDTWVEKDEMSMASELILVYLVKALNAATNATAQDRAAYAIQV